MKKECKIYVAGHNGLVGSSIFLKLKQFGYTNIVVSNRKDCDLTKLEQVKSFFDRENPEYVFLAAARCGGIFDNINYPVDYLLDNMNIQNNIISCAHDCKVKKLVFFASSCIFPKEVQNPIKEEYLLSGPLEQTNEAYSVAKIAGIKLCDSYRKQYGDNFISVNPCNIYGPRDKFDPLKGHVMSSLIYKFWNAKKNNLDEVICYGDGSPRREFLHSEDLADAVIFLSEQKHNDGLINIGSGIDYEIKEIADTICDLVGYKGKVVWDKTKPNGIKRKLLDVSKIKKMGWQPKISLKEGIKDVIRYLEENQ